MDAQKVYRGLDAFIVFFENLSSIRTVPASKHQGQSLSTEDEQADVGRDGRTRCARPFFSGANGDRGIFISPVQLITSRIATLDGRSILCYI